jgi:hypothetical protein
VRWSRLTTKPKKSSIRVLLGFGLASSPGIIHLEVEEFGVSIIGRRSRKQVVKGDRHEKTLSTGRGAAEGTRSR